MFKKQHLQKGITNKLQNTTEKEKRKSVTGIFKRHLCNYICVDDPVIQNIRFLIDLCFNYKFLQTKSWGKCLPAHESETKSARGKR